MQLNSFTIFCAAFGFTKTTLYCASTYTQPLPYEVHQICIAFVALYNTENDSVFHWKWKCMDRKQKVAWKMTNRFQWNKTIKGKDLKTEENLIPYWICACRATLEFSSELHIQMPVSRPSIFRWFYIRPQENFRQFWNVWKTINLYVK